MFFSILMPVYNTSRYLKQSIESILGQDFSDWELVVVDDGSTDLSGEICDYYERLDCRVRVLHKENGGLISARREGLKYARGEYVLFADSDDFMEKNCCKEIKKTIDRYDAEIVIYNHYRYYTEEGLKIAGTPPAFTREGLIDVDEVRSKLVGTYAINSLCAKAIKRTLFDKDPIDYSLNHSGSYGEDKLQSLYPVFNARRIAYINICLYNYRMNTSSMMNTYSPKLIINRMMQDVFEEVIICMKRNNFWSETNKLLFSSHCYFHMRDTFERYIYSCKKMSELYKYVKFDWKGCLPKELSDYAVYRRTISAKERWIMQMVLHNSFLMAIIYRIYLKIKSKISD